MEGFVIAAVLVGWMVATVYLAFVAIDRESWSFGGAAIALFTLGVGALFQAAISEDRRGPCAEYETQMHYNPATKTVMPARVCVNRGEWMEPRQ